MFSSAEIANQEITTWITIDTAVCWEIPTQSTIYIFELTA